MTAIAENMPIPGNTPNPYDGPIATMQYLYDPTVTITQPADLFSKVAEERAVDPIIIEGFGRTSTVGSIAFDASHFLADPTQLGLPISAGEISEITDFADHQAQVTALAAQEIGNGYSLQPDARLRILASPILRTILPIGGTPHAGKNRRSGGSYYDGHLKEVAILVDNGAWEDSPHELTPEQQIEEDLKVAAAINHDGPEDTFKITGSHLRKRVLALPRTIQRALMLHGVSAERAAQTANTGLRLARVKGIGNIQQTYPAYATDLAATGTSDDLVIKAADSTQNCVLDPDPRQNDKSRQRALDYRDSLERKFPNAAEKRHGRRVLEVIQRIVTTTRDAMNDVKYSEIDSFDPAEAAAALDDEVRRRLKR